MDRRAGYSSLAAFSRAFTTAYGETPYGYLMTRRIERAMALLRRGDLSVTEVCMEVGCTSLGSFSSRFTEIVGESPSAYRVRSHAGSAMVPPCVAKSWARPSRNPDPARNPDPPTTPEQRTNGQPSRNGEAPRASHA